MSEATLRHNDTLNEQITGYWEETENGCQLRDSHSVNERHMANDDDSEVAKFLRASSNPNSPISGYLRVSDPDQRVRSQVMRLKGQMENNLPDDFDVEKDVRWFIDEGTSATKNTNLADRPEGKQLHDAVENGEIDFIFAKKVDRMFRDNEAGAAFVKWMNNKHPNVTFITSDVPEPLNTPNGEFLFTLMVALARKYAADLSVVSMDGVMASQDSLERTSEIVYGWDDYDSGRRRITQGKDKGPLFLVKPNWKEQDVRDWFIDEAKKGVSIPKIVKQLNRWGLKNKSGNDWTKSSLSGQVKKPAKLHKQLDNPKHNFKRPVRSSPPFRTLSTTQK
jgi:DNA invertase Pin-like site-specific DNA recombinase